jgi:hypothetical protein
MMTSFNVYGEGCDLFFENTSTLLSKFSMNLNSLLLEIRKEPGGAAA